jgi:signal transduction histidine kinase/pSer/pThr/pTyr-binding forkhead associated (FHA) protein
VPPSLFVVSGRDQGAKFELEDGMMGLGRDSSNFIQVHDTEVSRRHAEIRRDGEHFTVVDLASSNGTFVNGERVEHHQLASGDRVQVGSTLILFTDPGDAPDSDLSDKIDIVMRGNASENSRIVRSMSQQEGSAIFDAPIAPAPARGARLDHARRSLQIMYRTALAVSHTQDLDQLLTRIMHMIFDWVEADRGTVMLMNEETKQLEPRVHHHRPGIATDEKLVISKTILDYVTQHGEGVLTSDAREDDRWTPAVSILKMGVREAICVPMQGRYGMVGVIYIDTSLSPQKIVQSGVAEKFDEEHLKLMIAIAHQAALAVEDTRYHQAMVQAERLAAVGQTIATLSHHIKNILQGIRGGSYLIEMGLSAHDEAVVRKGWGMVERNQNKISALVMDMLTFSKEREPEPILGDLNATVTEVVELMQTRAAELEVALDWQPATEMPQILFDPEAIHRAVLNVVTNALDACDKQPGGRVVVSTANVPDEKMLQITVEDNGVGIPPEDMEKIFTIFVSQKGSRGTGLGLPVSQKILKEHGGRIRVESTVGTGSRFILELPAVIPDGSSHNSEVHMDTLH